jgi:hypothetical protein
MTKTHYLAALAVTLLATPAVAQKADRLPDTDGPKVVRTIPITPSFDQRWFGPKASDRWISNQPPPSDRFTPWPPNQRVEPANASTALPEAVGIVPVPGNRLRHDPPTRQTQVSIRKPDQATCLRHSLRTVWTGQSWRCRR